MKIKNVTWQHRYDFSAIMECKHCGKDSKNDCGYDDDNYHRNVIPVLKCPHCGSAEND